MSDKTEETAPTCAQCGIEWEEGTGANEFGCWNCGSVRSVNVSPAEAKEMRIAYTRAEHLRIAEREIKAGGYKNDLQSESRGEF